MSDLNRLPHNQVINREGIMVLRVLRDLNVAETNNDIVVYGGPEGHFPHLVTPNMIPDLRAGSQSWSGMFLLEQSEMNVSMVEQ